MGADKVITLSFKQKNIIIIIIMNLITNVSARNIIIYIDMNVIAIVYQVVISSGFWGFGNVDLDAKNEQLNYEKD